MVFQPPAFELHETVMDRQTRVVEVSGELHVSTAPEFAARLEPVFAGTPSALVIDLSGVEFIDSTGLSVLLNGQRRVDRSGGRLALVVTNPTVLRLFEITRLDKTFDIRPTREEALASVRAEAD